MTTYEYEHNFFILYKDSRIFINRLNNSQRGELLLAIFNYVCDGVISDFNDDVMLQMCFDMIKAYLDRDEKKYQQECKKNKENIEKRWSKNRNQSNTKVYDRNQSNTNYTDKDTDKDTDTVSDTDTDSDTDNETETDQAYAVSGDRQSASAAAINAEPPPGDLFSVEQLVSTSKRNKVELSSEGVKIFHEEMQESGWVLYGKPIEKKGIVKALRGWAKYHPEYAPEKVLKEEPVQEINELSIEDEIMEIAGKYITLRRFEENSGATHCLIRDYCPREEFTREQLEYMADNWGVYPLLKEYTQKDEYWKEDGGEKW